MVSRTHENTTHHYTWADVEHRARKLVRAMQALGIAGGPRRHAGLERLPTSGGVLRGAGDAGDLPYHQPASASGRHLYIINHAGG